MFSIKIDELNHFLHKKLFVHFKSGKCGAQHQIKSKIRHICAELYYRCSDYGQNIKEEKKKEIINK